MEEESRVLGGILKYLGEIKKYYVEHEIEYKPSIENDGTYIIAIFIRVKADEKQVKSVIPMLDTFLKTLFTKGKIALPLPKQKIEKMKRLTRMKLRIKGMGVVEDE